MGTRNLTVVKVDGKVKIAQYCQWDGYPSGQGADILDFLKTPRLVAQLRQNAPKCSWIEDQPDSYIKDQYEKIGIGELVDKDFVTFPESKLIEKHFPHWHRNLGAKVLNMVAEAPLVLENSYSFNEDELFCEWSYLIDMDQNTLSVYTQAFSKPPMKVYDLNNLPKQKFLSDLGDAPAQ